MPIRLLGEKMSGRATQMCAICGVRLATTRDHVPPKAILVRPFPKNLITVPACVECNNGSAPMDSDFRVYLAAGRRRQWRVSEQTLEGKLKGDTPE
jgi:hypothetical protein